MGNRVETKELKTGKIALLLLFGGCMVASLLAFFVHSSLEGEAGELERKASLLFGAGFAFLGLATFLLGSLLLRILSVLEEKKEEEMEAHDQGF